MENRILSFTGIHNFRDYGGYAARDGARVRTGVLFRSSQHRDATAEDLAAIDALQLSTVIDLRGDSERSLYPCPRPSAFGAEVRFAAGETAGHAPHVEAGRGVQTAEDAHRSMAALYRHMPFRPNLVEIFRLYFDALAHRDGKNLIHCLAGKDRTGIAVALLHDMLGVHPDDMMADYLLTNVAGNIEARIAAGAEAVRQNFGPAMEDAAVRTLMSVDAAYLDAAFEEMIAAHGSLAAYRRDVLGVNADVEARIVERLL
jgi:protein-tyrosine phosphatase